jgi:hypothetical protein
VVMMSLITVLLFSVDFRKLRYIIGSELHIERSVSDHRVSLT